jgi:hypothetical protein
MCVYSTNDLARQDSVMGHEHLLGRLRSEFERMDGAPLVVCPRGVLGRRQRSRRFKLKDSR